MSRFERIKEQMNQLLSPDYLKVEDESFMHSVPKGAESHFKLTIVSTNFTDKSRVERHRMVNQALIAEFEQGLHALSLYLHTPAEWDKKGKSTPSSPKCLGGSQHDKQKK